MPTLAKVIGGTLVLSLLLACHPPSATPARSAAVTWAGLRSSHYGIRPFPSTKGWVEAMKDMASRFPGSEPVGIWIVGTMGDNRTCALEFPGPGATPNIQFAAEDRHESTLKAFDEAGVKVFLQVEPADAEVNTLIDLVMARYGHHPCVAGFGVDVEWHKEADNPKTGLKVDDALATQWEARVKARDSKHRLFLKHWDRLWMPPTYRGDLIFVSDSQQFTRVEDMVEEFSTYWAAHFAPNPVMFQVGYPVDRAVWGHMQNPPQELGTLIAQKVGRACGIVWVDFTLRDVDPKIR